MTMEFVIKLFFEILAVALIVCGVWHEDKLIKFEDKLKQQLKRMLRGLIRGLDAKIAR